MKERLRRAALRAGESRALRWAWDLFFFGASTLNSFALLYLRADLPPIRTAAAVLAALYAVIFCIETLMLLLDGKRYSRKLYCYTRRVFKLLYMAAYLCMLGYRQASLGLLDHPTREALRVGAGDVCLAAVIIVSSTSGFWSEKALSRLRHKLPRLKPSA